MPAFVATEDFSIPEVLNAYRLPSTVITRSPGRINLIGEHTDYNNGYVLPAAIDKAAYIALTPRTDKAIHLFSIDLNDSYTTHIDNIEKSNKASWPNYMLGIVQQFKNAGVVMGGFDAALTADIPIGAGLSSSAAVECAMGMALDKHYKVGLDKLTLVKMAQKAEHEFAGVQCGIMDQFASVFGKRNHVIKLDCRSLEYVYEPFAMDGIKIVLLDTQVKHSLGSSAYNERRLQCEQGVAWMQEHAPQVKSLRDATLSMLDAHVLPKDALVYQRCKYVVEENERLLNACQDLEAMNMQAFGQRMFETHEGLSKLYEVSCPELDFLVNAVKDNPAVIGARMMGAGFGGCTINLVAEDAVDALIANTTIAYKNTMQQQLKAYIAKIETGTSVLSCHGL